MRRSRSIVMGALGLLLLASGVGCTKKVAVAPPPPPQVEAPPPPQPNPPVIAAFAVQPATIERGQSATLEWRVTDATRIEIDHGIGSVAASGERRVAPDDPTTYRLLATGPGGEATASTTLQVNLPAPPPPKLVVPLPTISERLSKEVQDVYFNFDRSEIRPDARDALAQDAVALRSILTDFPSTTLILEGHCDERGSAEYNLGLGDRRGSSVKSYLRDLGLATERLLVISYGKERPQCTESNEECWQKNRRVHFSPGEDQQTKAPPAAE
jgi:peptidoglycan-associated lipoprotein